MNQPNRKRRKRDADEAGIFSWADGRGGQAPGLRPGVGTAGDPVNLTIGGVSGMGTRVDPIDLTTLANTLPVPTPAPAPAPRPVSAPPVAVLRAYKPQEKPNTHQATEYRGRGAREVSLGYNPFWINAEGVPIDYATRMNKKSVPAERQAWLESFPKWKTKLQGWVGKKILGQGAYGIAGLFELPESEALLAGYTSRKIVVKQVGGQKSSMDQLRNEDKFLRDFKARGSKHIVRVLDEEFYEGPGQGTMPALGTIPGLDAADVNIARMYLEFCEGGDLSGYIKNMYKKYRADDPIPEEHIWLIFKCLALGLCMMAYGSEDEVDQTWNHEIVHFDLKPDNILIGTNDEEHRKTPVFKLADFGLSEDVPLVQDKKYWWRYKGTGTLSYYGPEQYIDYPYDYPTTPLPIRFGTALNVWQVAKLMACIILRGRDSMYPWDPDTEMFDAHVGKDDVLITTMCIQLLDAPYSVALRKTVLRGLAYNHADRPTPRELVTTIDEALKDFKDITIFLGNVADLPLGYDEPEPYFVNLANAANP